MDTVRVEWRALLAIGVLVMVLGVALIAAPEVSSVAVTWLVGVALVAYGVLSLAAAWLERVDGVRFGGVVFAILAVLAGLLLSFNALEGTITLTAVLIAWLFADGIVGLLSAPLVDAGRRIAWAVASAVSIVLAVLLVLDWPSSATWVLGVFAGIALLLRGAVVTWAALEVRRIVQVDDQLVRG